MIEELLEKYFCKQLDIWLNIGIGVLGIIFFYFLWKTWKVEL